MNADPLDLSPLDPDHDPDHADRFVRSVMARVHVASLGPSHVFGTMELIATFAPRALAAAALVICVSAAVLVGTDRRRAVAVPDSVAESIGIPPAIAQQLALRTDWPAPAQRNTGPRP